MINKTLAERETLSVQRREPIAWHEHLIDNGGDSPLGRETLERWGATSCRQHPSPLPTALFPPRTLRPPQPIFHPQFSYSLSSNLPHLPLCATLLPGCRIELMPSCCSEQQPMLQAGHGVFLAAHHLLSHPLQRHLPPRLPHDDLPLAGGRAGRHHAAAAAAHEAGGRLVAAEPPADGHAAGARASGRVAANR